MTETRHTGKSPENAKPEGEAGRPAEDLTALLPDGTPYAFWEKDCKYARTLYVGGEVPAASDQNDGSAERPLKTIQRAADLAEPGTRVPGPVRYRIRRRIRPRRRLACGRPRPPPRGPA